ncbi:MAG: hypothetical protein AAF804_01835 [Bacteroidota bacterium]
MKVEGTIRFIDLSGGFWGIESDDGRKFAPIDDIPSSFRKDGLRVKTTLEPSQVFSIMMWGEPVEVKSIQSL